MKSLLSKISITTLLVVYLFFCGGLYLLAYWSTFGFDITNYISFQDIPKSFIFPELKAFGIAIIILFCYFSYELLRTESNRTYDKIGMAAINLLKKVNPLIIIAIFITLSLVSNFVNKVTALLLIIIGISFLSAFSIQLLLLNEKIQTYIPNVYKRTIILLSVFFIPGFIFMTAKIQAVTVFTNVSYYGVSDIRFKTTDSIYNKYQSLKLLGKLGNHIFLTDTSNSVLTILNTDEIKIIEYKKIDKSTN